VFFAFLHHFQPWWMVHVCIWRAYFIFVIVEMSRWRDVANGAWHFERVENWNGVFDAKSFKMHAFCLKM